ncbi:MAG TPA: hypothetical protein VKA53_02780 [Thermoanaerobaculia bacterium]|nr:hypothetical protein [Thermoanaerobaculia bacterium]
MFWNSYLLVGAVSLLLVVVAGCGEDEKTKAERWVNEVVLVNGGFQETAAQGKKAIASAKSTAELEAAYRSYAEAQRTQLSRFEELEPPEACVDEQADMERFMRKVFSVTNELADQASLTPTRLKEIEGEVAEAMRGLILNLQSMVKHESC